MNDLLIELRCTCGKLLCKVTDAVGITVQVKCNRCKETVTAQLAADDTTTETR